MTVIVVVVVEAMHMGMHGRDLIEKGSRTLWRPWPDQGEDIDVRVGMDACRSLNIRVFGSG